MDRNDPVYKSYLRAVSKLPPSLQHGVCDLKSNCPEFKKWDLRDSQGELIATVANDDFAIVETREELVAKAKAAAPKPQTTFASKALLRQTVTRALLAVGRRFKPMARAIVDLDDRLKKLESHAGDAKAVFDPTTKALDVAMYDAAVELAERFDALEAELKATKDEMKAFQWRARGYWKPGTRAEKSEVWFHDGCSWLCVMSTTEKPDYQSMDWRLVARKGRDSKRKENTSE